MQPPPAHSRNVGRRTVVARSQVELQSNGNRTAVKSQSYRSQWLIYDSIATRLRLDRRSSAIRLQCNSTTIPINQNPQLYDVCGALVAVW